MDDTHELPCHSWNLIGPLVVSALKLGIVCPRRILNIFFLLCFSLGNSRVEAQLLTESLSQAEAAFIRSARPARRVSDREGAILCSDTCLIYPMRTYLTNKVRRAYTTLRIIYIYYIVYKVVCCFQLLLGIWNHMVYYVPYRTGIWNLD